MKTVVKVHSSKNLVTEIEYANQSLHYYSNAPLENVYQIIGIDLQTNHPLESFLHILNNTDNEFQDAYY